MTDNKTKSRGSLDERMPEGFKVFDIVMNILHFGKFPQRVDQLKIAKELMAEMSEALESLGKDYDEMCKAANGEIEPTRIEALEKFREWK